MKRKIPINKRLYPDSDAWQPEPKAEIPSAEEREAFYARLDRTIAAAAAEDEPQPEQPPAIGLLSLRRDVDKARKQRQARDARRGPCFALQSQ